MFFENGTKISPIFILKNLKLFISQIVSVNITKLNMFREVYDNKVNKIYNNLRSNFYFFLKELFFKEMKMKINSTLRNRSNFNGI